MIYSAQLPQVPLALLCSVGGADVEGRTPQLLEKGDKHPGQ